MRDLVILEQNFSDTEKYLGFVLPMQIQAKIYENLLPLTKNKELKLGLLESTFEMLTEQKLELKSAEESLLDQRDKFIEVVSLNKVPYVGFKKEFEFKVDLKDDIKELK